MHSENRYWWEKYGEKYAGFFYKKKILECGSRWENGSIRELFINNNFSDYIGVDWREGKNVEVVSLIHDLKYSDGKFDVIVSASLLEHDPYWASTLATIVRMLSDEGIFLMTWGSAKNEFHAPEHCPDYSELSNPKPHHPHKAEKVLKLLESLGMHTQHFGYERSLDIPDEWWLNLRKTWGPKRAKPLSESRLAGMAGYIGFKNPELLGDVEIEEFHFKDLVGQPGGV